MKHIFSLLILFFTLGLFAQSDSPENLLRQIRQTQVSDSTKASLIYDWVTRNIAYDHEAMQSLYDQQGSDDSQKPEVVLTNRKALCDGYANLVRFFCQEAGLPARVIIGYSKENNEVTALRDGIYHAWNAVQVEGEWRLLDATWGASYGSDTSYVSAQNRAFFFTRPAKFAQTHLPFDPVWQLLSKPVTLQQFTEKERIQIDPGDYNFRDTILANERLDSLDRQVASMRRMLEFDPTKVRYHYGIANIYSRKGSNFLTESEALFKQDVEDGKLQRKTEILELLNQAKESYRVSLRHLAEFEEVEDEAFAERRENMLRSSEMRRMLRQIQHLQNTLQQEG